jgi:hypothetical protein
LAEEISKRHIQAVPWLLLAAFSQVYSENQEQKAEQKDLKMCSLARKGMS